RPPPSHRPSRTITRFPPPRLHHQELPGPLSRRLQAPRSSTLPHALPSLQITQACDGLFTLSAFAKMPPLANPSYRNLFSIPRGAQIPFASLYPAQFSTFSLLSS